MADWNWFAEDSKESIVVPQVDAIAVYENADGDVVMRQQSGLGEDKVIIIPRGSVSAVVKALSSYKKRLNPQFKNPQI